MSVATYTKSGAKATTAAKLDNTVFGVETESHSLLKQAYNTYLANGRENLAKTLKRGEVSGGGKKPWKQKGTGRARFGSSRVPIWRGGGIVFGPLGNENYSKKLSVQAKRTALRQALSVKKDFIIVIDEFDSSKGKVSETVKFLQKIDAKRRVLLVLDQKNEIVDRATSNVEKLQVVHAKYLNVYDILNADSIVITAKSLEIIHEWLGKKKETK